MKTYTEKDLIKAMIWAENNGKHYIGTDKKGQLKQFTNWIKENFGKEIQQNKQRTNTNSLPN